MTPSTRPTPADPRTQLLPAGTKAKAWMFVMGVLLPCVAAGVALLTEMQRRAQAGVTVADASSVVPLVVLPLVTLAIWFGLTRLMRRHRLRFDAGGLEVTSSFYRTRVPLAALRLDQARVVDLAERTELKPALRSNGFSVPGFKSGWYRLRNRRKAFVAGVGERRWLWLPTTGAHDLLLQPGDPQRLLQQLRELAQAPPHA